MLDLDEQIPNMKVIHVAGTKGKVITIFSNESKFICLISQESFANTKNFKLKASFSCHFFPFFKKLL